MRTIVSILALLLCVAIAAPRVGAQSSHVASQAAIDEALQQHLSAVQADRDVVLRLLERPDVRALAGDLGLDLQRARAAISTLEGRELGELAARARAIDEALAGGQSSVTISTTLLIIGLLVLIILILVLK